MLLHNFFGRLRHRDLLSEMQVMKGVIAAFLTVVGIVQCASAGEPTNGWIQLFNGRNFDGLDVYLAPPPGSKEPLGLNNDPRGVFTITNADSRPAIHVSGEIYGGVSTKAEFTN